MSEPLQLSDYLLWAVLSRIEFRCGLSCRHYSLGLPNVAHVQGSSLVHPFSGINRIPRSSAAADVDGPCRSRTEVDVSGAVRFLDPFFLMDMCMIVIP